MSQTTLTIESLSYKIDKKIILNDINIQIKSGRLIGIIGPNGAGKTSLLKALVGFDAIEQASRNAQKSGRLFYRMDDGQCIDVNASIMTSKDIRISYMPQFEFCHWDITVLEMLNIAARHWISSKADQEKAIQSVSEELAIIELWQQKYQTLSGGQRTRVLIARSLINNPHWFYADEPIASLDVRYQHEILSLLRQFVDRTKQSAGCVLVLHDLNLAHQYCDEVIIMKNGACVAMGDVKDVMTDSFLSKTFDVPISSQVVNSKMTEQNTDKVIFFDGL